MHLNIKKKRLNNEYDEENILYKLNDDLLHNIFEYFNYLEIFKIKTICKKIKDINANKLNQISNIIKFSNSIIIFKNQIQDLLNCEMKLNFNFQMYSGDSIVKNIPSLIKSYENYYINKIIINLRNKNYGKILINQELINKLEINKRSKIIKNKFNNNILKVRKSINIIPCEKRCCNHYQRKSEHNSIRITFLVYKKFSYKT